MFNWKTEYILRLYWVWCDVMRCNVGHIYLKNVPLLVYNNQEVMSGLNITAIILCFIGSAPSLPSPRFLKFHVVGLLHSWSSVPSLPLDFYFCRSLFKIFLSVISKEGQVLTEKFDWPTFLVQQAKSHLSFILLQRGADTAGVVGEI